MGNSKLNFYRISLKDGTNVTQDKKAKSLSFFCNNHPVLIDANIVNELKELSRKYDNANCRICMHNAPDDDHHDMIILEKKDHYYPPHRHEYVGETFHMIEGSMGIFSFNNDGTVLDCVVLKKNEIYRIAKGSFHAIFPLSDYVVYHEGRKGPFLGENDSLLPDWAPNKGDLEEIKIYMKDHEKILKMSQS